MRARLRRTLRFMVMLAFLAAPGLARAEECKAKPAECGKREFEAGIAAYQKGDYRSAAVRFEAAQGHRAHPVVLFNWALAQAKLGQLVEALARFEQVLKDPELPSDLRPKVDEEKARAERDVAVIEVEVASGSETTVDGAPAAGDPPVVRVNPGEHAVKSVAEGRVLIDRTVRLRPGERLRLSVDRSREVIVQSAKPAPSSGDSGASPARGVSPAWFFAGAGVTVVLGAVTTWSAMDTRKAFDEYERDLPRLSQSEADQRVDDGHGKELRTNLLLGATALAAVGTAALGLFVVDWGGSSRKTGIVVTPNAAMVRGVF